MSGIVKKTVEAITANTFFFLLSQTQAYRFFSNRYKNRLHFSATLCRRIREVDGQVFLSVKSRKYHSVIAFERFRIKNKFWVIL